MNGSQDILSFGDFMVPKIVLQNKIFNKMRKENQEILHTVTEIII